MTAALGVPFFFTATGLSGGSRLAVMATWLFVVYPESVLTGGAQMREPFLLSLIAVTSYGFVHWSRGGKAMDIVWMALGLVGMLLVSPAVALTSWSPALGGAFRRRVRARLRLWLKRNRPYRDVFLGWA
jgi:hypothetical protein